jgi:serine protease Do
MRLHRPLLVAVLLGAALAGAAAAASAGKSRSNWKVDVVKRVGDAVVSIHSERTVQGPSAEELFALSPSQNRINGMGTGILIDPRGYIVTNHHVVEDVNLIRVRLADGTAASARVLARDAESDLALLKIDVGRALPVIPLGTAADLQVGEDVLAIGNAYGYDHTVTVGVVSAVKRDVTLNKEISYKALIQTDAAINPGNSGGPLLNVNGELVGVNVAIRAGAQGIGFAIPVDTMMRVAADMMSVRRRNGTTHGLAVSDRVEGAADGDGEAAPRRSLVVDRVDAGGPGERAGVQRGDVVVHAGDLAVACGLDLERALLDRPAGERVPLVLRRGGQEVHLDLALQAADRAGPSAAEVVWQKLGVRLQPVSAELVAHSNQQLHGGLLVVDVRADGAAGKAGIQRGDVLVGLHQWEMLTPDNVVFVLTHPDLASFNPLRFYIVRAGQVHRGWLQQVE